MLDQWFLEDVIKGLKKANRFVIIDEQKKCRFFLELLTQDKSRPLFEVTTELDEVRAKYEIEKHYINKDAIIFTTIPLDSLKFLREYCETCGCLNIAHIHRYIAQRVKDKMGFDLIAHPDEIIAIGKLSFGKDKTYWQRIKTSGVEGVFAIEDILEFLDDPEEIFKGFGKEEKNIFTEYMSHHTAYSLEDKPSGTIASEIIKAIFDNLLHDRSEPFLEELYKKWVDSKRYESALKRGISSSTTFQVVSIYGKHRQIILLRRLIRNGLIRLLNILVILSGFRENFL